MKIFLPFKVKDIGGTSTFARKFKEGMEAAGHSVTFEPTVDYDILFLIVQCPLTFILDAKRRGKKIVQRLDGTYYWSVSGWKFPLMNAKAAYIRHFFTDLTIYQSKYSRECANRFLGKKFKDNHAIIYNGVDLRVFTLTGKKISVKESPNQKIFFTASAFRRKDQIVPLLKGLEYFREKYKTNFKFLIAGTFIGEVSDIADKMKKIPDVEFLGKINNAELPLYARSADVFLFTHLNPPCPNNVIESLACGVPVCGVSDGAMSEIIREGQDGLLIPAPGTGFWRQRDLDIKKFADNLFTILQNNANYKKNSREAAEALFSLQKMISNYTEVMEALLK